MIGPGRVITGTSRQREDRREGVGRGETRHWKMWPPPLALRGPQGNMVASGNDPPTACREMGTQVLQPMSWTWLPSRNSRKDHKPGHTSTPAHRTQSRAPAESTTPPTQGRIRDDKQVSLCLQSLWSSVSAVTHPPIHSPECLRPLVLVSSSSHKEGEVQRGRSNGVGGEGHAGLQGSFSHCCTTLDDPTQTICEEGCAHIQGQPKTQMKGMTHAGGLGERTTLASHLRSTDIHLRGRGLSCHQPPCFQIRLLPGAAKVGAPRKDSRKRHQELALSSRIKGREHKS